MIGAWNDPTPNSLLVMLLQDWQGHRADTTRLVENSTAKCPESTHEVLTSRGMERAAKRALARAVHACTSGGGAWKDTNWTYGEDLANEFQSHYWTQREAELARPALIAAWEARNWPEDGTCLDTGLPRGECECADYNPANPTASHPDQRWFDQIVKVSQRQVSRASA